MARKPYFRDTSPGETRNYSIAWTAPLNGDTISSSTFSVETGSVTIADSDNTTTSTSFALSGGTIGETAQLLNSVTTSAGETLEQRVLVRVRK